MSIFSDNTGFTPVPGFNFLLRVEMAFDVPVKSVRAFTKNFEYEYIQEGGLNDYVHMRRKPISQPFTLEIERYAATDLYYDPLQNGTELMLPLILMVSPYQGLFMGYSRRTFVFTGCTVTGKEYGALDAEKGALLTEVIKIAYRQVAVVDLPETIAAEKTEYIKDRALNSGKFTLDSLKKEAYGRQVGDMTYAEEINKSDNPNAAAYIGEGKKFTGDLAQVRSNTYETGEVGKKKTKAEKEKEWEDSRKKPHHYGADDSAYKDILKNKDTNKNAAAYIEQGKKFSGDLEQVRSNTFTYIKKEAGEKKTKAEKKAEWAKSKETPHNYGTDDSTYKTLITTNKGKGNQNAAAYTFADGGKGNTTKVRGNTDDPYDTMIETNKKNKKVEGYIKQGEKFTGKTEPVRAHKTFDYIGGEAGSASDANKRSYPKDESYYGKDIAEKFKSSAKNNSRSWPKTESYYGKEMLQSIKSNAKKNGRTWPPTESAFGIEQMKNKGKK